MASAITSAVCWRVDRLLVLGLSVPASVPTLPLLMQAQLASQWQTGRLFKFLLRVASRLLWRNRSFLRALAWSSSATELGRLSNSGGGFVDWSPSWGGTDLSPLRGLGWKTGISEGISEGKTGPTPVFTPLGGDGAFHFQKRNPNSPISLDFVRRCLLPCFNLKMKRDLVLGRDWVVGRDVSLGESSFRTLAWDLTPVSSLWQSWWSERLGLGRIDPDGLDRTVGPASSTSLSRPSGWSALVQICRFDGRQGLR